VDGNNKEDHHEDMNLMREDVESREDQHDDMDLLMRGRDLDLDSIDSLTDPTPCALLIYPGGYQIEVARGLVYPKQTELHTVPILDEHVVVKVEYVHMNFDDHVLKPPPNDETLTLGQALMQRIQWNRRHIIVNPKSLDGSSQSVVQQTIDASAAKSTSLNPSKDPSKDIARSASGAKSAAAAEKPFKSSQHKAAAAAADKKAAAAEPDKKAAATAAAVDKNASAASEKKKTAAAAGKKKASAGTAAAENASAASEKLKAAAASAAAGKASAGEKKKASAGEKKKAASTAAKESKKQPSNVWTKAHPKFTYGQAILTEAELLVTGRFTVEIHNYYMKGCQGNKKNGIVVKYRSQYFWRDRDTEVFLVGFDDLYDLFKLDALDVSLLRCFTL